MNQRAAGPLLLVFPLSSLLLAGCGAVASNTVDQGRASSAPVAPKVPPEVEQRVLARVTAGGGSASVASSWTVASDIDGDGGLDYGLVVGHEHDNSVDDLVALAASGGEVFTTPIYGSIEGLAGGRGSLDVRVNSYAPGDGHCCPSGHMTQRFVASGGALKRVPADYPAVGVFMDALHDAGVRCENQGKSLVTPDLFGSLDHAICLGRVENIQFLLFGDSASLESGLADAITSSDPPTSGNVHAVVRGPLWFVRINAPRPVVDTIKQLTGLEARQLP